MGTFVDSEFDSEEANMDDNAIMSGKQYKILNSIRNSIVQFINDNSGKSNLSGKQVEFLWKSQEYWTQTLINNVGLSLEEYISCQFKSNKYESKNCKMLLGSNMRFLRSL